MLNFGKWVPMRKWWNQSSIGWAGPSNKRLSSQRKSRLGLKVMLRCTTHSHFEILRKSDVSLRHFYDCSFGDQCGHYRWQESSSSNNVETISKLSEIIRLCARSDSACLAIKSMVRIWSQRTIPVVLIPVFSRLTEKPFSRAKFPPLVIGATTAVPVNVL